MNNIYITLQRIVDQCGIEILRDGERTIAFFMDLEPYYIREIKMLESLIKCGGHTALLDALQKSKEEQMVIRKKVIQNMMDELVAEDVACEVCNSFWKVIGGELWEKPNNSIGDVTGSIVGKVVGTCNANTTSQSVHTPRNRGLIWRGLGFVLLTVIIICVLVNNHKDIRGSENVAVEVNAGNTGTMALATPKPIENPLAGIRVGDTVVFGEYEQDGNLENGAEELRWIVLDKTSSSLFIITEDCIDCGQYNVDREDITWQSCTLRDWLNEDFYSIAFTSSEKNNILSVTLDNPNNAEYGTYGGSSTNDKVFILSLDEAKGYFASSSSRRAEGTEYAKDSGIYVNTLGESYSNQQIGSSGYGYSWWWLRSPGSNEDMAACIVSDGNYNYQGSEVDSWDGGIRPAMWISALE